MQHRLAHQVHRHRRAMQQQELQQHWADVVASCQGGAEAQGVYLEGLALGGSNATINLRCSLCCFLN